MKLGALAILMAACGGAHPGGDPDAAPAPDGRPGMECAGKSLADLSLAGIYHTNVTDQGGYERATSFRIDDTPSGPVAVLGFPFAGAVRSIPLTVGASLVATTGDTQSGQTLTISTLDADCTMHGTWRSCQTGGCVDFSLLVRRTDRLDEPVAHGMTLVSELDGKPGDEWIKDGIPVNVRVAGGYAYVATYQDGLRIVDVHDPAHPVEVGHLAPEYPAGDELYNDVKIAEAGGKRYAIMASDVAGAVVVDVTAPSAPAIVAHFGTPPGLNAPINVHTLFLDGGKAYLANVSVGLEIWDLADPTHPQKLGEWAHERQPETLPYTHDLYVHGARAYVNYWDEGMSIVDVSNPAAPTLVGEFTGYGQHTSHSSWVTQVGDRMIAVHGDEQWDAHLHVVDVTEGSPDFGKSLAEWRTRPEVSIHNLMAFGSRAYAAYYQDGVRVLDLSDPTHPQPIAWFDTWPGYSTDYGTSFFEGAIGIDVDLDAKLIYVADSHRGLIVLHLDI